MDASPEPVILTRAENLALMLDYLTSVNPNAIIDTSAGNTNLGDTP